MVLTECHVHFQTSDACRTSIAKGLPLFASCGKLGLLQLHRMFVGRTVATYACLLHGEWKQYCTLGTFTGCRTKATKIFFGVRPECEAVRPTCAKAYAAEWNLYISLQNMVAYLTVKSCLTNVLDNFFFFKIWQNHEKLFGRSYWFRMVRQATFKDNYKLQVS